MDLFPRFRPRVALLAKPLELTAGEQVELRVRVDAPRPRKIERADLWLRQLVRSSKGTSKRFELHAPLCGSRTLPEGLTELTSFARIPSSALPDHAGRWVGVSTVVSVSLMSRWRFDVKRSFQLRVRGTEHTGSSEPLIFSSRSRGRDEPHLEGSLDRSVLWPGGMLTGRVAAIGADCRRLEVYLVVTEEDGTAARPGGRWRLRVDRELKAGESVPFAMSVPAGVTPTFRSDRAAVAWAVELHADRAFARDLTLRIPVKMAPSAMAPGASVSAPKVGDERVAALWERVAAQTGSTFEGGVLRDRVGPVDLTIRPGAEALEAHLAFPALGIDLVGGEREGLRRLVGAGKVPALGDHWNRHFYAGAREPAQAEAFLGCALGHLVAVRFHSADDSSLTLTVDAKRDDGSALERLLRLSRRVAERIPDAAKKLPVPTGFDRAIWERAALALEAELWPGPPRLDAVSGAWILGTRWPERGEPLTRVSAKPTTPIDERLHGDSASELPEALGRDARPLAEALAADGRLRIAMDEVVLEIPGLTEDPAALEPALDRLARLVRLLRVDAGPYR